MTTFYLVRHGANDWVGKAIAGWTPGVHLNNDGVAQAERLAERLAHAGIDRIASSPLERARETAAPLAQRLKLEVEIIESLGELRFGEWTGRTFEQIQTDPRWKQWNQLRGRARIPGGETMLEAQARVTSCLASLAEVAPGGKIAVFSHGDPIRAALLYHLGMPIDFVHRLEISPGSISVLRLGRESTEILRLNDTEAFD